MTSTAADEASAPSGKRRGVIIPLHEDISPLSGALLKRKFQDAIDSGVDVIVLDIESPGGWVNVTFELMDMVGEADDIETVAYIAKDAISGAALVSLATDTILMHADARMGDAGEIVLGPDGAFRYTEAKSRSVLAQKVRDTAEATGRPIALAEKMTDKDMIVYHATNKVNGQKRYVSDKDIAAMEDADQWRLGKPIREAGKDMFFTVNGRRAVELGMADQVVESREDMIDVLNLQRPVPEIPRTGLDTLVLILNSKPAAFLLVLMGLTALGFELSAPGLGIGGLLSLLCFGIFFWARFLGGTAGWLEVLLFVLGIVFIGAEIFVIPGFGVAGITGLAMTLFALVSASRRVVIPTSMPQWSELGTDVFTVLGAFAAFVVAIAFLARSLGDIPGLSRLTLKPQLVNETPVGGGTASLPSAVPAWQRVEIGQQATSVSPLRPGGKVLIDNELLDVVTEGDYVDTDQVVTIIAKQGSRIVVRSASESV
ncbi:MAG: peptidase [Planctomycetota bacterium]